MPDGGDYVFIYEDEAHESTMFGHIFGKEHHTDNDEVTQYWAPECYSTFSIPSSLREVSITENVTSIELGVFSNCFMLEMIEHDSVTEIAIGRSCIAQI